jgi:phospho-N-acetylmuramoyl-pentapeptide-transferase
MLYHLIYPLSEQFSLLNVFRYITVRAFVAFVVSTIISIIWGHYFIRFIKNRQFGQVVRDDGPQSHLKKMGTPTMGGVFMIGTILLTILICGNFSSLPLWLALGVLISYAFLGFLDDYLKVIKKNTKGVRPKLKLLWQIGTAFIISIIIYKVEFIDTQLYLPFLKGPLLDLGWLYIPFSMLVIVGSSNAVNLTDGLDGLAMGPIITSAASLGLLAYVAGHLALANYLFIPFIHSASELVVLAACIIGAGVGFLWYNAYPAQIFMGDVGSLSLGGTLGTLAVLTKNEVLFVLIGGIFVIETLSVIIQVISFKLTKKRVFKMAPIHHHFELKGWPEPKVIVRFWIISILLAILAISTLKIR